jgi:hypothetical protein
MIIGVSRDVKRESTRWMRAIRPATVETDTTQKEEFRWDDWLFCFSLC